MTNRKKELAKFFCGVQAFHAFVHTYFWLSGRTLKVFGLRETPEVHRAGAIGSAVTVVALGVYAWGQPDESQVDSSSARQPVGNEG